MRPEKISGKRGCDTHTVLFGFASYLQEIGRVNVQSIHRVTVNNFQKYLSDIFVSERPSVDLRRRGTDRDNPEKNLCPALNNSRRAANHSTFAALVIL